MILKNENNDCFFAARRTHNTLTEVLAVSKWITVHGRFQGVGLQPLCRLIASSSSREVELDRTRAGGAAQW